MSAAARIDEFMRTHVSRYVLPGKLAAAQIKGAATVSVPTADMARLLARVGEHIAPVSEPDAPTIPAKLEALPTELADLMQWDENGEAIVSREQVEALIAQVARIAYETPRAVKRRKPAATVTETVAAALAADKRNVTIPTAELARMLDTVEAERHIPKENAA